jgi:hypothetical protein
VLVVEEEEAVDFAQLLSGRFRTLITGVFTGTFNE